MRTALKVAAGVIIGGVLLIAGCSALLAGGADEVEKEISRQQNRSAITQRDYRSVRRGDSRSEVERRFGEPMSQDEVDVQGAPRSDCIYYNRRGGEIGQLFQFCFEGGRLVSKAAV